MKNVVVFILYLFIGVGGFTQTDTIEVVSFNLSECKSGDGCIRELDYRIVDSNFNIDTLEINIKGIANCAGIHNVLITRFDKEIFINFEEGHLSSADTTDIYIDEITGDTIYSIDFVGWSEDCDCFYDFNFNIVGLNSDQIYHYYINGNIVLEPISQELIRKDSLVKDSVKQIIQNIEEIKESKNELRYVICKILPDDPKSEYYYHVKIFEDGNYSTLYEFKVFPSNNYKVVYYYWILELNFEEWRKYRGYPEWNEKVGWDMTEIIRQERNDRK